MVNEPVGFSDIEELLRATASSVVCPPTPPLARAVRLRLAETSEQSGAQRWTRGLRAARAWRGLAVAAAVLVALLAGAMAAPVVRDAVARFFHVSGVDLQRTPHDPGRPSTAAAGPEHLGLGAAVVLEDARRQASFPVRVPAALGEPDQVYLLSGPSGLAVTLVYLPRPGLPAAGTTGVGALVTEVPGSVSGASLLKLAGPSTRVEEDAVGPDPGFWITGHPHQVVVELGQDSNLEQLRLAGDTLVWSDGRVVSRLEASVGKQAALDIARSMR